MLKLLCIALLLCPVFACADVRISVRTENAIALGTNCDPEFVIETAGVDTGGVDSRCQNVQFLPAPTIPITSDGEVSILIGNPLNEFFQHCELVSTYRTSVKEDDVTAWNFECREGVTK